LSKNIFRRFRSYWQHSTFIEWIRNSK